MIFKQSWFGKRCGEEILFPATVPGNIQYDYSIYRGFGDLQYSDNHKKLQEFEDDHWEYVTELSYKKRRTRESSLSAVVLTTNTIYS